MVKLDEKTDHIWDKNGNMIGSEIVIKGPKKNSKGPKKTQKGPKGTKRIKLC